MPSRHPSVEVLTVAILTALLPGLSPAPAAVPSCTTEIGAKRAAALAQQCREVSPGTRPPCNVADRCQLMEDEIRRSCRLLEQDAPEWCSLYVDTGDDGGDEDE